MLWRSIRGSLTCAEAAAHPRGGLSVAPGSGHRSFRNALVCKYRGAHLQSDHGSVLGSGRADWHEGRVGLWGGDRGVPWAGFALVSRSRERRRERARQHTAQGVRRPAAATEEKPRGTAPPAEILPARARRPEAGSRAPRRHGRIAEVAIIVLGALGLAFLVQAFLVKTYRIPSGSMEPTLAIGQRVLVNRVGMHFGDPKVRDIVVFHPPQGADEGPPVCDDLLAGANTSRLCDRATPQRSSHTFIKRVVGVGGDRIALRDGHVIRNGRRVHDPYIRACGAGMVGCGSYPPITVPKGSFYVLGDNRGDSDDSRYWGPVKRSWIIGEAFATYWPPDRVAVGF